MAVFMINVCKFNGCGITFPTLQELIRHIEYNHLNFENQAIESYQFNANQATMCLPISYVLRVFTNDQQTAEAKEPSINKTKAGKNYRSGSPALSISSTTPTGSEMDEDIYYSESEDSWSIEKDQSSVYKMMTSANIKTNIDLEKPYMCSVNGCKKRYRNANGLKYHIKSVHPNRVQSKIKSQDSIKSFKCDCGKTYKTANGLKNHISTYHQAQTSSMNAYSSTTMTLVNSLPKQDYTLLSTSNQVTEESELEVHNSNWHNVVIRQDETEDKLSKRYPTFQHHLLKQIEAKNVAKS